MVGAAEVGSVAQHLTHSECAQMRNVPALHVGDVGQRCVRACGTTAMVDYIAP
jgi:hypothetical protein